MVVGYSFWSRLLALLRVEFRISKFTLHSDLRRRAALRLALPCPSSFKFYCMFYCTYYCSYDRSWHVAVEDPGVCTVTPIADAAAAA